ncbi:hypothetical protein AB0N07_40315 [Streptomyces sp. NPDC051172]|uniref:hypothetical protein n=1 Tax=Streptomyces sp. NPDC051172 TaxID=3155796 RepID=UPI00343827D0
MQRAASSSAATGQTRTTPSDAPGIGVVLGYDSNGDGYLDTNAQTTGIKAPVWLRLTRTGSQLSGYYSTDGSTFTRVGSAVNLSGAKATEDVGVFHTSHDGNVPGTATFGSLSITTPPFAGYANIPALLDQHQSQLSITGTGADVWGAGGQHDDQYGAIYQSQAFTNGTTVTTKVNQLDNTNPWAKAGIMVRNSIGGAGSSAGYAVMAVTPGNGVVLGYDSDGDGYLDSEAQTTGITAPVWLRLTRTGSQVSGYYSTDGTTFTRVGSAVNLSGAKATEDVGVFHTSHDNKLSGTAGFSGLSITP